jgi:hypothetical protein
MEQQPTSAFQTATGQNVAFDSGIAKFENTSPPRSTNPNAVSPNAVRWLWNPCAYCDVSDRPISGYLHLPIARFIPIIPQTMRVPEPGRQFGVSSPGKRFDPNGEHIGTATADPNGARYTNELRTAYAIANELADAYTDRGVQIINSLTGVTDEKAIERIFLDLIADGLSYADDLEHPDYPVPNLVKLDAHLRNVALPEARRMQLDTVNAVDVIADVIKSVGQAIAHCRGVTNLAKRVIANRTPGYQHAFDAYQKRCFMALGEQTPNDLGEMWGTQTNGTATAAPAPVGNSDEVARLRAENEQLRLRETERQEAEYQEKIKALEAENERLKGSGTSAVPETAVATCDFIKADGSNCKGSAISGTTRCRHHPLNTNQEEADNGNEEG